MNNESEKSEPPMEIYGASRRLIGVFAILYILNYYIFTQFDIIKNPAKYFNFLYLIIATFAIHYAFNDYFVKWERAYRHFMLTLKYSKIVKKFSFLLLIFGSISLIIVSIINVVYFIHNKLPNPNIGIVSGASITMLFIGLIFYSPYMKDKKQLFENR